MDVSGQLQATASLPLGRQLPVKYWIRGRVGHEADLDAVPGTEPPTFQPRRYTDRGSPRQHLQQLL
jgi:hypothetical protein